VVIFGEDLSNVAPFYIFTVVSKGPWLRYILLASEGQHFWDFEGHGASSVERRPPFPYACQILLYKVLLRSSGVDSPWLLQPASYG
jgi:hypothetical protein